MLRSDINNWKLFFSFGHKSFSFFSSVTINSYKAIQPLKNDWKKKKKESEEAIWHKITSIFKVVSKLFQNQHFCFNSLTWFWLSFSFFFSFLLSFFNAYFRYSCICVSQSWFWTNVFKQAEQEKTKRSFLLVHAERMEK